MKLNRVRAVDIADVLVKCLENLGLSLSELRGQGYDGTSRMSGHKSGVQARIQEKQPKAVYTHCTAHSRCIHNARLTPALWRPEKGPPLGAYTMQD